MRAEMVGAAGDQGGRGPQDLGVARALSLGGRGPQEGVQTGGVAGLRAQHGEPRIRRPARLPALLEGRGGESVVAVGDQAREQRMLRVSGLDQNFAGAGGPSCAPGDLGDGLGQPLSGAKIAGEQALIGVQDHHQADFRKMMALREHLRADQDAGRAAVHAIQHALHRAARRRGVAVQPGEGRGREQPGQSLLHALGTLAHRVQGLPAAPAGQGHALHGAAVMAAQLRRTPVQRHVRIAMRAGGHPAAGAAEQRRRVAAAVQEHDHLAARRQMPADGLHRGLRQALLHRMPAQVDQRQPRGVGSPRTLRQHELRVARLRGVLQALQRRRRRTQNDRHVRALCAPHREIACGVAESLVLLVGGIVLLVDHDEGEPRQGGENGGTGADHDAGAAAVRGAPRVAPLGARERRMHDDDPGAEAPAEAIHELRRECDFGHQHQGLAAAGQRRRNGPQVHLGLAAAGHAVQEMRGESAQRARDRLHDQRLLIRQGDLAGPQLEGRGLGFDAPGFRPASFLQHLQP